MRWCWPRQSSRPHKCARRRVNAIAALMTISAYPFWALCLFGVDLLVIYGLAAYGGQRRPIG
jgi:hypothetical protein